MKSTNSTKQKLGPPAQLNASKNLAASSPISLIQQEMKYFSPFQKSTEAEVIDEIRSLGQQILQFEEVPQRRDKSQKSARNLHSLTSSLDNKLTERVKPVTVQYEGKKMKPKFGQAQESMTKSLTESLRNETMTDRQQWEEIKKNTQSSRRQPTKPTPLNMYDKYKNQMKAKRYQKIQNKTSELYSDFEQFQSSKNNSKEKLKNVKPRHNEKQSELNYTKYIDRNVQKLVKEERQWAAASKKSSNYDKKPQGLSFLNSNLKQKKVSKEAAQKSFENVLNRSQEIIERKFLKANHLREEMFKKQMQQATFKPKLTAFKNYESKNRLIGSKPDPNNFVKRQKMYKIERASKEKQILEDLMEDATFRPKINAQSRLTDSITKSIWSSHQTSTASFIHSRSIEKFKESTFRTQNSEEDTLERISLRSAAEMKFLFN